MAMGAKPLRDYSGRCPGVWQVVLKSALWEKFHQVLSIVKTAQRNMRHAGPEIMLRKYAQVVTPDMQSVQVRWFESCRLGVGQNLLAENAGSAAIQ
jgi:hypothetical protein